MSYDRYKDGVLYNSQSQILLPKEGVGSTTSRHGVVSFLLSSNRNKSTEFIDNGNVDFIRSGTTRLVTDSIYTFRYKNFNIRANEKDATDKYYKHLTDFILTYIPSSSRTAITSKGYNVVSDLSRWMYYFFNNTTSMLPEKKCDTFIKLLNTLITSNNYSAYGTKLLIIDLDSWVSATKECIIMNPSLLDNPINILMYCARVYPEIINTLVDIRILIVGNSAKQLICYNSSFIRKENYSVIKSKLSNMKSIVFSVDDTILPSSKGNEKEISALVTTNLKNNIISKVRAEINTSTETNTDDITQDTSDMDLNDDAPDTAIDVVDDIDDTINDMVSDEFDNIDTVDDIDVDEIADKVTTEIQDNTFRSEFVPSRNPDQQAKIDLLLAGQSRILESYTKNDVERMSIPTSDLGSMIDIDNPNLQTTKFSNFDRAYVEKQLERNIDNSVGILSKASDKIFIESKEVTDTSTPLDLVKTYTYNMIDEKGNKMTIKFDIPTIIDDNYIYINGSKKGINHQFILKPLVKTAKDTVQLVTAYNKVFIRRVGRVSQNINSIITFFNKNIKEFSVVTGISHKLNEVYDPPIDFIMMAKNFSSFKIGDITYYMEIDRSVREYKSLTGKELKFDAAKGFPIGIDRSKKTAIIQSKSMSYTDTLLDSFDDASKSGISKIKRKPNLVMAKAKMLRQDVPLILFMMYCVGFKAAMNSANIEYLFVDKSQLKSYSTLDYGVIAMADGYVLWKKSPFRNELLMNGLRSSDLSAVTYDELESKDTYIGLLMSFFPGNSKFYHSLDNYRDFLLDDKTKEILYDFGYPVELVPLLVVAAGMLCDNSYLIENNMHNMRIRSSEVIADIVYLAVTGAYNKYRNTAYKKKPTKVSLKKKAIINKLISPDVNMIEEFSTHNPILEIEKTRVATFKGLRGIQKDRAMTLPRRAYDKSMLGTIGITTSPDANVGIVRQMTMEPQVTSTYGYIDANKSTEYDELKNTNLFTVGELINPFGVTHDDPDRTSMAYKQTKYMIPIKDSDPVLVGNKVEQVLPYLLSDEFIVDAKERGKVLEKNKDYCIIEYESGKRVAIEVSPRVRKNSSQGTWADNTLRCDLKPGDTFIKGDILAYNDKQFSKNLDNRGASLNLGAMVKIAISSQWDIFEDSIPITKKASDRLSTDVVDEKSVTLSRFTHIDHMVKVGDKVKAGDILIKFADATDEEIEALLSGTRDNSTDDIIDSVKNTITSKYTGEIIDIRIYNTAPLDKLSPTLLDVVEKYQANIKKKNAMLDKYKNKDDQEYYKAGQIISETDDIIKVGDNGKIKGHIINPEDDVLILIYTKYTLSASKGDKVVVSVCKGIISHVIDEGSEPYSEYRPDEPIDTVVAPLAVAARKVPAIFLTIFTNKLMVELKRQMQNIYNK